MTTPGVEGNDPSTVPIPPIPAAPAVVEDPLLDTLPGAVMDQLESPMVLRVGVVAAIQESTRITVRVSGSEVLVDCSYLFNQYFPILGDRVILVRQDSQWLCLGTATGPIGSNNNMPNSSFEDPPVSGVLPTGWTITVVSAAAGVPFFITRPVNSATITGKQSGEFGVNSVVPAAQSVADVYSPPVATSASTKWTAAYWLPIVFVLTTPPKFSDLEMHMEFLNAGAGLISSTMISVLSIAADSHARIYQRLSLSLFPSGFLLAPAGTSFVRLRFRGIFNMSPSTSVSFILDNVILRQVF